MVADSSGGTSKEAHDFAMQRMIQAGVIPVTWQQVMLEWQRDWARKETYTAVMDIVREHSGAYAWAWITPTPWCTKRRLARRASTAP